MLRDAAQHAVRAREGIFLRVPSRLARLFLPAEELPRIRYAALLACPLHLLSTAPYAFLFALFGAWLLAGLVVPLCLSYLIAWGLLRKGFHHAGVFLVLGAVTVSITLFSVLMGKDSHLEVALFYCTLAPFLFFPAGDVRKILLANLLPAAGWIFLEAFGYRTWKPYALSPIQLEIFGFLIMPTTALLLLVPQFFLLRGLGRTECRLREALEDAQNSSRVKGEFLAMVSHELKTPLNGMLGIMEMLEREGLNARARDELEMARSNGRLLDRIIGDMLDFARMEKGMAALVCTPVRLDALLSSHLVPFGNAARAKGLGFRFEAEPSFPVVVADGERIVQILANLVGNAIKFTAHGEVRVHLSWHPLEGGSVRVCLEVEDTGVGIPPERRNTLFTPFVQLHRSIHANAGGCGLGLAISRQLAELMGGEIVLEENRSSGSMFRFRFTAVRGIVSEPVAEVPMEGQGDMKPFRGHVLVVDDVRVNQIVATRMLVSMGFECEVADDGEQALDRWRAESCELIFMDLQMPVMDGVESARAIYELAREEERVRPVVVALTANTFEEHREQCRRVGMDAFLEKPLSRTALLDTLKPIVADRLPHMLRQESSAS